jgi:hypothetical protein
LLVLSLYRDVDFEGGGSYRSYAPRLPLFLLLPFTSIPTILRPFTPSSLARAFREKALKVVANDEEERAKEEGKE